MKQRFDLPVPERTKYGFEEMIIGECREFDLEPPGAVYVMETRLRSSMKAFVRNHPDKHFKVRKDRDAGVVRIWRDR